MALCPVCGEGIPDEFGLLECESCGAQLLIHVDGHVEHSGAPKDLPKTKPRSTAEPLPAQDAESQSIFQMEADSEPISEPEPVSADESESEEPVTAHEPETWDSDPAPLPAPEQRIPPA